MRVRACGLLRFRVSSKTLASGNHYGGSGIRPHSLGGIPLSQERRLGRRALIVTICIEAIVIVALVVAYSVSLVPYAVVWGDVGTWVQAIATMGGLLFAGFSLRVAARQLHQHREAGRKLEEERKDVVRRSLSLRSEWKERLGPGKRGRVLQYAYELSNHSSLPVTNVKIVVHSAGEDDWIRADGEDDETWTLDDFYQGVVVGVLAPHECVVGTVEVKNWNAIGLLEPDRIANPPLYFTDPWGIHWKRPGTTWLKPQQEDVIEEGPQCMCCGEFPARRQRSWGMETG